MVIQTGNMRGNWVRGTWELSISPLPPCSKSKIILKLKSLFQDKADLAESVPLLSNGLKTTV